MKERRGRGNWARWRIRLIGGLFAFFFVITSARAFYLQVVKRDELVKLAEKQHQKIVPLTPARGAIYDRNNAPLAVSVEMDSCYAEPRNIENIPDAAAKLAPLLGMTKEELAKKLAGNKGFAWLARRIPPDVAQRIRDLDLDGIGFVKESKRFYPNSEMAGSVIGFTGVDPEGLDGIELKYDSTILGSTGYLVTERDALGRDIAQKGTVIKKASKGQNVVLTLDKNIQYIAEKELADAVEKSRAKGGIALVMEPQTGRVLAMANYPFFNPNSYFKYPQAVLRNRSVADSFEPGSTFKVFLISGAIEEKVISPNDGFNCEGGSYSIGGRTIHDTHHYGRLSVADVLKYSSNIGAAKIGARMGQERLYSYLRGFGFGARSGIDLPGEASGYMRDRSQWFAVDLATISFGQGVSATAVQLAAAFSAVANGGTLVKPFLVERITDENGTVLQQFAPQARQRVISPETARTVTRMMEGVTTEGGTGMNAAVEGYRVAGKTGTAQKVDPITHGYSTDKRTASFIGFIPADDPKLTILVVIDEPKTSPYGGVVAAPAFKAIAQQTLCYLHVPPNKAEKVRKEVLQVKEVPAPVDPVAAAAEGSFDEGGGGAVMADFRGQSIRQVMRTMEKRGLNVRLIGSGKAVEQNPLPGHRIGPADHVWVRFAPAA
ncbi:MAG TPA: penicillin-binding protein [Geobacteraceae bacterium]